MSDQNWAIQMMFKYRLQIDFSKRTIDCVGFNSGWYWDKSEDFYRVLTNAVNDIVRAS